MPPQNSFTFKLTPDQQDLLKAHLAQGNYRPAEVPHTVAAVKTDSCSINLYVSGKCLVQGKGAQEWVEFVLEPQIMGSVGLGYEEVLSPEMFEEHMGIDESGKGDFFGPLVISAVFVNQDIIDVFRELNVRDSKTVTSDRKALSMARDIHRVLDGKFSVITIGPEAYNRLYMKMGNVNKMLAWGHARAIENLLEKVPGCPRAVSDQFGPKHQIEQALLKKGQKIRLEQRPKAESDPAVAGASILARAGFVHALGQMGKQFDMEIPKGASEKVRQVAQELIRKNGPEILIKACKCHFRTADQVLEEEGFSRSDLGELGAAKSKTYTRSSR